MAVTRLERKGRKNKNVAKVRVSTIKRLNTVPSIKNVDVEEIKADFAKKMKPKKEITKVEVAKKETTTKKEVIPKATKKETVPKKEATPKK